MTRILIRTLILLLVAMPGAMAAEQNRPSPLAIAQIADGFYVAAGRNELVGPDNGGHIANLGFVVGTEAVAVIDTGGSLMVGLALKAAIKQLTDRPIKYVINTHAHPDHVFGNAAFLADGSHVIGHHRLARALANKADHYLQANKALLGEAAFSGTRPVLPTQAVEGSLDLDLGGRVLRLTAWPTAHTDTDLTVYDLRTRTLWLGDLLFVGHIPVIDGSLRGWLQAMTELTAIDAARVVPGHGPAPLPWPDAARQQTAYLEALATAVRSAIDRGLTLGQAVASIPVDAAARWVLADAFHRRNVTTTYAELEWE